MPQLEKDEIKKYWQIFSSLKPVENKVDHDQVSPILYNSKLDSSVLNKIWFLADIDDDDNLDFEEFIICMRFIYDLVNKKIETVPDELPNWLVPSSKGKLVQERIKTKQMENAELPKQEKPEIDWNITQEARSDYMNIVSKIEVAQSDHTFTMEDLTNALKTKFFNIGKRDCEKAWKLVNIKESFSVGTEAAIIFMHILKQRDVVGCDIPRHLPDSIKDSLANNVPIVSTTNQAKKDTSPQSNTINTATTTTINTTASTSNSYPTESTTKLDNLSPQDQISALEKELATIDSQIQDVQKQLQNTKSNDLSSDPSFVLNGDLTQIKSEFQDLLNYRKYINSIMLDSVPMATTVNQNALNHDLSTIEQQVKVLENYLSGRENELNNLRIQLNNM